MKEPTEPDLPPLFGDRKRWALVRAESCRFLSILPDHCVDAIVCDPPYGIGIKDQAWDGGTGNTRLATGEGLERFSEDWARAALRVLKPGGHLLSFAAARTAHRITAGLEDAGFEIRDALMWLYGSGVPKSRRPEYGVATALKPAYEPIILARKPLSRCAVSHRRTLSHTRAAFGTGALNIDSTRVSRPGDRGVASYWPPNVVLSHDERCSAGLCAEICAVHVLRGCKAGRGTAERFFYAAKASRREREAGTESLASSVTSVFGPTSIPRANIHPTVKPIDLMRWLVRLVTPPNGLVLDPFAGSGSTGCAVLTEGGGRKFIGIEREPEFVDIALARLTHWAAQSEGGGHRIVVRGEL